MAFEPIFPSYFLGGFECSIHVRKDGVRLDLIEGTRHGELAREDYARLRDAGILAARDGLRWHLIERSRGRFEWKSFLPMLEAARETGMTVVWDLLHFGWPDWADPFDARFPEDFTRFVRELLRVYRSETEAEETLWLAPVNEISFLSFAGGEAGFFNPFQKRRGDEMKRQLVRCAIAASEEVLATVKGARLVHTDPVIRVFPKRSRPQDAEAAAGHQEAQFAAWDMIAGRQAPELGGRPELLDVLGLNYYIHNQWEKDGGVVVPSDPRHVSLSQILVEVWERYRRPFFISETGIEAEPRPDWIHWVGREVRQAWRAGAPVGGVCIYPICDHPGWEDDRHCPNGIWGYADAKGERPAYDPFLRETNEQERLFRQAAAALSHGEAAVAAADEAEDELAHGTLDSIARSIAEVTNVSREIPAENQP